MNTAPTRETMVRELGLETLPQDAQDAVIAQVSANILSAVMLQILLALPTKVQNEFKSLTDAGKGQEAEALAAEHIPDLGEFIHRESLKELTAYKALAGI